MTTADDLYRKVYAERFGSPPVREVPQGIADAEALREANEVSEAEKARQRKRLRALR